MIGSRSSKSSYSRGRVCVGGAQDTLNLAMLSLLKTKAERINLLQQMAGISDEVHPRYLAPEAEVVLNDSTGTPWALRTAAVANRRIASNNCASWLSRFSETVDSMTVVLPRLAKEELRDMRIAASGWKNTPVRIGETPAQIPDKNVAETTPPMHREEERQLLCYVCMWGIDAFSMETVCCPHCTCVAHEDCAARVGASPSFCQFCLDDTGDTNRIKRVAWQRDFEIYSRTRAAIRLQAFVRAQCKRRLWQRLRSAIRSIQQAIRVRLFSAKLAKARREGLRPVRLKINHIVLFDMVGELKEVTVAKQSKHEEIGSIPAGLYERIFGFGAEISTSAYSTNDVLANLGDRHKNAPQYNGWEPLPSRTKLPSGSFVLQVCINEAQNLERVFATIEKKGVLFKRPAPAYKGRQLHRVDIPLAEAEVIHTTGRFIVASGLDYILIPAVRATSELTLTLCQIREWPKACIRGQAKLNIQDVLSKKKCIASESHLCSISEDWVNPSPEDGCKMVYLSWCRAHSLPHSPLQVNSIGLVSYCIISHTDEDAQQAGWINIHVGASKRRIWAVLMDRVLMFFQGGALRPKKTIYIQQCTVSVGAEDIIKVKTPMETIYISSASTTGRKEFRSWLRKMS